MTILDAAIPDGFLADILANPADDFPRLVLADWLEENDCTEDVPCDNDCVVPSPRTDGVYRVYDGAGPDSRWVVCPVCHGRGRVARGNGYAARSEFIRVQCELWNMRRGPEGQVSEDSPYLMAWGKYQTMRRREAALISEHAWKWLRDGLPEAVYDDYHTWCHELAGGAIRSKGYEGHAVVFTRGFISDICTGAVLWLQHGPAIMARQPVQVVRLTGRNPQRFNNGFGWLRYFGTFRGDSEPSFLPAELFVGLDIRSAIYVDAGARVYPTEAAANEALSRAALAWARQQARERGMMT